MRRLSSIRVRIIYYEYNKLTERFFRVKHRVAFNLAKGRENGRSFEPDGIIYFGLRFERAVCRAAPSCVLAAAGMRERIPFRRIGFYDMNKITDIYIYISNLLFLRAWRL